MTTPPAAVRLPRPPGPRGLPFLGVASKMRPDRSLDTLSDLRREYGDIFRLPLPGRDMVVVSHPDFIEHVLVRARGTYVKGNAYDGVRALLGDSLVTLEGAEHKARRSIAQPAFHTRSLKLLAETMVAATSRWFDQLRARFPEGGAIEVHREMTQITLEIVVECLFGRGFFERTTISYEHLTAALETMSDDVNGVPIPRWVPTPANRRFKRVLDALDTDVHTLIGAAREAVARGDEDDGSLLQMLLRARDAETGEELSDRALRDEVVTLFIAGHETTALTMTWFFDLVTGNEALIEALRREAEEGLAGDVGLKSLMGLDLTRRTLDEVLRLRPPAPWVARDVVEADVLGGFRIEPGDLVAPSFWLVHRHPDFWDEPERFDPDRFLPERSADRHRYAFVPFSTGPRVCIGNTFSYVEAAAIVSELVQRCTWTRVGDARPAPQAIATVRPSEPIWVELAWR